MILIIDENIIMLILKDQVQATSKRGIHISSLGMMNLNNNFDRWRWKHTERGRERGKETDQRKKERKIMMIVMKRGKNFIN